MQLKRIYNKDAPKSKWLTVEEECTTCSGKGVVVNEAGDGLASCPDCTGGVRTRQVPPVAGVEVLRAGKVQHFSPRLVEGGRAEGWLELVGNQVVITGVNKRLTYQINRVPGRYDGGRINYYDCELVSEKEVKGG